MKKKVLFIGLLLLSMMASITFISCGDDEEEEKAPAIEEGLMLIKKDVGILAGMGSSTASGGVVGTGAGTVGVTDTIYCDILEFGTNSTVYSFTAYREGKVEDAVMIPGHKGWVRSTKPGDIKTLYYTINESRNTLSLSNDSTYVIKYVNGKLYSLINGNGEEEWGIW